MTEWDSAPPSDHEEKAHRFSPDVTDASAPTTAAWPTISVVGPTLPEPSTPSSETGSPPGLDTTRIVLVFGSRSIDAVSCNPPESVTVTLIRRNDPLS